MERHPNSHKVTIFRIGSFLSKAQNADTASFQSQSKEPIGSYFESRTSTKIGSGLSDEETALLLPRFIDREPNDRDYREKVSEFYRDITTPVPFNGGVELEIGLLEANDKPISKDNMPINVNDYIRYRHAIKHPHVALSKEAATGNLLKRFYVFDKQAIENKKINNNISKDAAIEYYLKVKEDMKQVDTMLILMGIDIREFAGVKNANDAKKAKLRELAEAKSDLFTKQYESGDIEIRGLILGMIKTKVLKEVASRILVTSDNEELGLNMEEAIYFFKDEANSERVIALRALYQESLTTPVVPEARKTVVE